MSQSLSFFAPAPRGLEDLLATELGDLLGREIRPTRGGVAFEGTLAEAYRVCLWSRLAYRLLQVLARFPAPDPDTLYAGVRKVDWSKHLHDGATFAVDANVSASAITHSHYAALKVKDALVDQWRDAHGARPSVDTDNPALRINLYLHKDEASLSIDFGGALHRHGYRQDGVVAPLREPLAAALLIRAGWPAIAAAGGALFDPLCGSGTLLIEGALIAADIAPGLLRERHAFEQHPQHDAATWNALLDEARERRDVGMTRLPPLTGHDRDAAAIRAARANAKRAGLGAHITLDQAELGQMRAPGRTGMPGLVIVNPPYGERLGTPAELVHLYTVLGERLRREFAGWHAAVFTADAPLGKRLGLRARRKYDMFNGALPCTLLLFDIPALDAQTPVESSVRTALSEGAAMFANRLRKNLRHWSKWAKREGIECYRVYDADLPEYACAIDVYGDQVNVQEYQAPRTIDPDRARLRRDEVLVVVPEVFGIPPKRVHYRLRQRQRGKEQYQKLGARSSFHEVHEGPVRCLVNLAEYLDTGLFLDHRLTRQLVGRLAKGKRVLNLFCYTATATLHAAAGGAVSTTSVDMSQRYLDWAAENLALNGLDAKRHRLIRADVLAWLGKERGEYDLIFLDPPTFSNSKRMEDDFDVLRDHVQLITLTMARLAPGGVLIFSSNHQRFKLDEAGLRDRLGPLEIDDLTRATLPDDFGRSPRIHRCYRITRLPSG